MSFTNKKFYYLLIGYIGLLLLYNITASIIANYYLGVIPIIIQGLLLLLIFKKNRYLQLILITWASIFLILIYGVNLFSNLLIGISESWNNFSVEQNLYDVITLTIGILIVYYSKKTILSTTVTE